MYPRILFAATLGALVALAAVPVALAQEADHAHHHHNESVVEFTAVDYAFEAPDVLPSGWNTLRFTNDGEETHFVILVHLPEGKTIDDYEAEVYPVFGKAWEALAAGEVDHQGAIGILVENAPEWFWATQFMGGAGLAAPGITSEVTVNLPSGNYVVECYMKTAEGLFHVMEGMVRPLVVTDEVSATTPPEATLQLTLSNAGMAIDGELTPGKHVVAVHWAENPEMGFPHDVNVARLDADADVEEIVRWMNWMNLDGLTPPYPAKFIGGARPMPTGSTAYFVLDLEPGRYLFVSEATGYRGVLKEVKVKE